MQSRVIDPSAPFALAPTRAARVSEISEATAASATAPEERINFHIGNPVQDPRLTAAYLRTILGLDIRDEELTPDRKQEILSALEWSESEEPVLDFLIRLIQKSSPYMPRGGYSRSSPHPLVKAFSAWLLNQQEPLSYDLGESSGRREIILASGGINESLRVFLHTISSKLTSYPIRLFLMGATLPDFLARAPHIQVHTLPEAERDGVAWLSQVLPAEPGLPNFLLMGKTLEEETRRALRHVSLDNPLFFVEINNAPNHLSLAREAKLADRVLRFLTPAIFSPSLVRFSTVFIAGNADYLASMETFHFQLKGTPSASEAELLSFILEQNLAGHGDGSRERSITLDPPYEGIISGVNSDDILPALSRNIETRLSAIINAKQEVIEKHVDDFAHKADTVLGRIQRHPAVPRMDQFAMLGTGELLRELIDNAQSTEWQGQLLQSHLHAFVRHHPEYRLRDSFVVSGSARTALGILGFHCDIKEVVVPDLSWTYEHCFPTVSAVPLTPEFALDAEAIINTVREKLADDPHWNRSGAVVINNPHNATGQVFDELEVTRLIRWLLEHDVFVIDDLSYQNVAPSTFLPGIKTLRQIAESLVRNGLLGDEQAERVVTVHSVSKTDCLAGARLAVVEIRHQELQRRFREVNESILPNLGAVYLTYVFYRNDVESARAYWRLRNQILLERVDALMEAIKNLPGERNPFGIVITPPKGSMYPLMVIERLPAGLSLEWLSSGLARQGIGMIPLGTFARTEQGFETGRKAFRLTLGGTDPVPALLKKTRRVLIDLNRMISEESANYNRRVFSIPAALRKSGGTEPAALWERWQFVEREIVRRCEALVREGASAIPAELRQRQYLDTFVKEFVPERLELFRRRFRDRSMLAGELMRRAEADQGRELAEILGREFYKDDLVRREQAFLRRPYDRTVHPTQMYSIHTEEVFERIIGRILRAQDVSPAFPDAAATELLREFFALNVAINSTEESKELILDLDALLAAEQLTGLSGRKDPLFLSFWGDWDGSNRPSGQGHRLIASVLVENVTRLSRLIRLLAAKDGNAGIDPKLLVEIRELTDTNRRFTRLLNEITSLTHQLERRYRGILPVNVKPGKARSLGMSLHLVRDPLTQLWRHNDRLERRMLELRRKRCDTMGQYFSLNKRLRKQLHSLIPVIQRNFKDPELLLEACMYRDLLQRTVITPRIHQKLITAQDQFAIDTTAHNINELNALSGRYGNPGIILALQVSMSTKPEALISLDRKMRAQREEFLREEPDLDIPPVKLIPLFEEIDMVQAIPRYLGKLWEYALQSRRISQETRDRFAEMVGEVFIAGSDLSQQVSQAAGAALFAQAKRDIAHWLAEHGLAEAIRLKLGSGEPMQRQGGYYAEFSGERGFIPSPDSSRRFASYLRESTRRSTEYATTPMMGVFSGGNLRTMQSTISEQVRYLPVQDFAQLIHHMVESQHIHTNDLVRASESLMETRLQRRERGAQELDRLTIGSRDKIFTEFMTLLTDNFRQILYGREEDVIGIHMISYFIARSTPPLRDRPTVRPGQGTGEDQGQKIIARIAETIPLSRYGSRLRAIAHNQAQTAVLGINQLTTGLFRALDGFARKQFAEGDAQTLIADRVLPHLPAYEILETLRLYHDVDLTYLRRIEPAFPAGNSAFLALREDIDAMGRYLTLFRQELLRRHGVDVSDFFEDDHFIADLLPTLRPDLAVLLQPNLFNTRIEDLMASITSPVDPRWKEQVERLLRLPEMVRVWRAKAWDLLEEPVFQRVQSFAELAVALHSLSDHAPASDRAGGARGLKLSPDLSNFFRMSGPEDEMRQFLAAALEYLSVVSEGMVEVPINIIRAMKEVERIAKIEEQVLTSPEQEQLRFFILQIARLAGENG
jgi:aspartate/methionine/tyrosine aminotransferase